MITMIVACGKEKQPFRCQAKDMYTGNYFRACLSYAFEFGDRVFIISAKYGLIKPDEFIDPYDIIITNNDAIGIEIVGRQIQEFQIEENPTILGGKKYVKFLQQILPKATSPLSGGLLSQIKWLNDQVRMSKERKQLKLWQN